MTVQGPVKEQQPDGMSHGGGIAMPHATAAVTLPLLLLCAGVGRLHVSCAGAGPPPGGASAHVQ